MKPIALLTAFAGVLLGAGAIVAGLLLGILFFCGISAITASFFWGCWNWVIVPAFHVARASFLQCFGVAVLLTLVGNLFKSATHK